MSYTTYTDIINSADPGECRASQTASMTRRAGQKEEEMSCPIESWLSHFHVIIEAIQAMGHSHHDGEAYGYLQISALVMLFFLLIRSQAECHVYRLGTGLAISQPQKPAAPPVLNTLYTEVAPIQPKVWGLVLSGCDMVHSTFSRYESDLYLAN